ncbi:MAG: Gfo/Idh/MocA family oxidoreductase [Myxococcales bacterium]|nr:Gfo/Idh/MocA family oxidoreductase [Myxococcales bacterium]
MRVLIVGAGHMGRIHAEKYRAIGAEWIGIHDLDIDRARALASAVGGEALGDLDELAGRAAAASICVPVREHGAASERLIELGLHLLIEKPITHTESEGHRLIEAARRRGVVLQVAHQERFNPAVVAAAPHIEAPRFVEVHRLGMPDPRDGQVDVIRDLMIHDLDLLLAWIDAPIVQIDAVGSPVLSDEIDIANARLRFATGCVANLTVSRVTPKPTRKVRVFSRSGYVSIDCGERRAQRVYREGRSIRGHELEVVDRDPVEEELRAFWRAIEGEAQPAVSGEEGLRALSLAVQIQRRIQQHREMYGS